MAKPRQETPHQQRNFVRYSDRIEAIKKPVSSALTGVLNYEKLDVDTYISAKLFNTQNKSITQQDIDNVHLFLGTYSNELKRLKEELMSDPNFYEPQRKLLLNIIQGNILRLILLHYTTFIEAEKGGYPLDHREREAYLQKVEKLETIIYGPSVTSQEREKKLIVNTLTSLFNKNSHLLNDDQKKTFSSFLEKFPERQTTIKTAKEKEKDIAEKLSMMDVCHLFQKIVTLYGLPSKIIIIDPDIQQEEEKDGILSIPKSYDQHQIKKVIDGRKLRKTVRIYLDPRVSGFGIGDYAIDIPAHRESISIKRLCSLIDHEINTHLLRMLNQKNVLNIRSESQQETEEGIAVMNEKLAIGKREDLTIDAPLISNIGVFVAEHNDFTTTKEIMKIYYLLSGNSENDAENLADQRALRTKRYHAFDQPGANRKDVVYRRGLEDAISYIKNLDKDQQKDLQTLEQHMRTFYMSKLGKEEIQDSEHLFDGFTIDTKNMILPIALGKLIYEKLLGNTIDASDDIRFLAANQKLDYKQKRLLLEIISFIKDKSIKE